MKNTTHHRPTDPPHLIHPPTTATNPPIADPPTHCRPIIWNPSTGWPSHHRIRTLEPTTIDSLITSRPTYPPTIESAHCNPPPPICSSLFQPTYYRTEFQIIAKKLKNKKPQQQRSALG